MKKWQEERNYRRVKDENGNIIANIIMVDGVDVKVTEEVFLAYSQADRRERYQDEQREKHPQVSLDLLSSCDVPIDLYMQRHELSAEEFAIQMEEQAEHIIHKKLLAAAMNSLAIQDQELIQALYFENLSTRAYAKQIGLTQRAIVKRRDRILRDLHNFFEKNKI